MHHVLVIGGGGREHALAWKLVQSPRVSRVSVTPGNAGTAEIADNIDIDATDVVSLLEFAESQGVDLAVVGPEEPLASGLVDQFEAAGIPTFGPRRQAAMIETSKSYAKQLMVDHGVPTAPYNVFTDFDDALDYLLTHSFQDIVIKADGLARGKGVFLPKGESDAEGILRSLLERDALGRAGRRVVIEQRLIGDELSVMAFTDGRTVSLMPAVRDYKQLHEWGLGPNTGGMGSYAPAPTTSPDILDQIKRRIIEPVLQGLQREGCCFAGVVYAGVVLTQDGPMALELNARFSDTGAQTVMPLLESDLLDILEGCINRTLNMVQIRWRERATATVVLASAGYPERRDPGLQIHLPSPVPDGIILFHAGTRRQPDGTLVTTGGRVLNVTSTAPDLPMAVSMAYSAVRRIHFDGMQYRRDIGANILW